MLIDELAAAFGAQCVVLGVDSQVESGGYCVKQYTGSLAATRDAGAAHARLGRARRPHWGAGEIVLNCMARDGVRAGYDLAHTRAVVEAVSVPVIASGGAGLPEHFRDVFVDTGASGALAATVFHDDLIDIPDLKEYLATCGIEMRR